MCPELLEIRAEDPKLHVLVIPGNPGIVSFYTDFVESLYELLRGTASITGKSWFYLFDLFPLIYLYLNVKLSLHADCLNILLCDITAIGHISHTRKNWERGRLFSLQEQIDHKLDFIKHELENIQVPILLVGHSIGSYISIEIFRRFPEKVMYCVGLYPFLVLNQNSHWQSMIGKIASSRIVSVALSSIVAVFGLLPRWSSKFIVTKCIGKSWCSTAIEAACDHMLQYHVMRNVLYMAMTEFEKRKTIGT